MLSREDIVKIVKANSSVNMTVDACERQAERVADALMVELSLLEVPSRCRQTGLTDRAEGGSPSRYFVSEYADGPATRWNVIDRQTQEWVRRFPTEAEAQAYAKQLEADRCLRHPVS